MNVICLDLEGVLVPEIWINVAEKTGIEGLRLTTRDISDYDELMAHRLKIVAEAGLTLPDIQSVIDTLEPMEGAQEFVEWAEREHRFIILSDTFEEFAGLLMAKLGHPTLFCHNIDADPATGELTGYRLRQPDQKRKAVAALKSLNFQVAAAGDSYNDTTMLGEADHGFLFRPPPAVVDEFPQYPVCTEHHELRSLIEAALP